MVRCRYQCSAAAASSGVDTSRLSLTVLPPSVLRARMPGCRRAWLKAAMPVPASGYVVTCRQVPDILVEEQLRESRRPGNAHEQ